MTRSTTTKLIFLFIFIALVIRLPLAWKDPAVLIPKVASDDMFYYLEIARNMAEGNGPRGDSVNISNGFHPLFALLLVPLARVSGDDRTLFIHLALTLLTLCAVLSALPLYALLNRFSNITALFVCMLWLFCPFPLFITLSGTEVPVYVLCLGLLSLGYLKLKEAGERRGLSWILLGLLASLAVLARIDGALFTIVIAGELFFLLRRRREAVLFALAALAGAMPWFVWSSIRTGHLLQVSGKAIRYQTHLIFERSNAGTIEWLRQVGRNFFNGIETISILNGVNGGVFLAGTGIVLIAFIILAVNKKGITAEWFRNVRPVLFLPVYGFIALCLYSVWLWYSQNWYYYAIFFSGCILVAAVLDFFERALPTKRTAPKAVAWILLFALMMVGSFRTNGFWWHRGIRWWQSETYKAALWCSGNLPENAVIGSFNSGILSYYSDRTVVNLDGVVNPAAYEAMRANRTYDYIRSRNIDYIVESPRSLLFRNLHCGEDIRPHLAVVHRERDLPENNVTVYKLQ
jgi:hypothetical protein